MEQFINARYPDMESFMLSAKRTPSFAGNQKFISAHKVGDHSSGLSKSWAGGVRDAAHAMDTVREGYPAGEEKTAQLLKSTGALALPPTMDRRRRLTRGDQGDSVDMSAMWRGRSDIAWTRAQRRPVRAPVFATVVIDWTVSGSTDANVIAWRGAVAIAFCRLIEARGFRCRIVCGFGGMAGVGRTEKFSCRVVAKEHGRPLDAKTVTSVMHPCVFRLIGLTWIWSHQSGQGDTGCGICGKCNVEKDEIYIGNEVRDFASALRKLQEMIAKLTLGVAA